ncbi:MAG: hypothetical protein P4N59_32190 [Negativicutes bacterium]|nr:hypothetical protein [Negativicutes bacterium]
MKKLIVSLSALVILFAGLAATSSDRAWAAPVSPGGQEFEGEWVISNYREGDVQTTKYDGTVVTISKQGGLFHVDGASIEEAATPYQLAGNDLVGTLIPDAKLIKHAFPALPNPSLSQAIASGKIYYNGRMSMGQDGLIQVEFDGITLFWKHNAFTNYFDYVQQKPGWYKYTLARKGATTSTVNSSDTNNNTNTNSDRVNAIRNRLQQ